MTEKKFLKISNPKLKKRYQLGKIIGKGGQGHVVKGYDREKGIDVAIKLFSPQKEFESPEKLEEALGRFKREIDNTQALQHPNIVNVYDFDFYHDNSFNSYMSMEYVIGGPLSSYIKDGSLSLPQILTIICDVASALDYAHNYSNQVLHRDIKPGNILLASNSEGTFTAKVTDFGLSKRTHDFNVTAVNNIPGGTYWYMAKDYLIPRKDKPGTFDICPQTDVYALGVTMYYALTKQLPLKAGNFQSYFFRLSSMKEHIHPNSINENIQNDVNEVCMRAIALDKKDRYPSMKAFRNDLMALLQKYGNRYEEDIFEEDEMTATVHSIDTRELIKQISLINQGSKVLVGRYIADYPLEENSVYTITNDAQYIYVNENGLSVTDLANKEKTLEIKHSFVNQKLLGVTYIPQQTKTPFYAVATQYGELNDNNRIYLFHPSRQEPIKSFYFATELVPQMAQTPSFFCHGRYLALANYSQVILKNLVQEEQKTYPIKGMTLCSPQEKGIIIGYNSNKKGKPCIGAIMISAQKQPKKLGSIMGTFDHIAYNVHENILYASSNQTINAYKLATASDEQRKISDTSCVQYKNTTLGYKPQQLYSTVKNLIVLNDENQFDVYSDEVERGKLDYLGSLSEIVDNQFESLKTYPYNNFVSIQKKGIIYVHKL